MLNFDPNQINNPKVITFKKFFQNLNSMYIYLLFYDFFYFKENIPKWQVFFFILFFKNIANNIHPKIF